jgi:hypothetical protein
VLRRRMREGDAKATRSWDVLNGFFSHISQSISDRNLDFEREELHNKSIGSRL